LELLHQDRHAFLAAALVADRVLAHHFLQLAAVLECDRQRVGDRAFLGVVVIPGVALVLDASYFASKNIYSGILRNIVLVIGGGQAAEEERHSYHVLDAVIPIRRIAERTLLVDD